MNPLPVDENTAAAIGNILSCTTGAPNAAATVEEKAAKKLDENTAKGVLAMLKAMRPEESRNPAPVLQEAEMPLAHPQKKAWLKTGDEELTHLLPNLSSKEETYLEMIGGKNYQAMVERLEAYTGIQASDLRLPSLLSIMMQSLSKIKAIESKQRFKIQNLALEAVLEFPEFSMVKEAYENDELGFDVKLELPNLQMPGYDEPEEGELADVEEQNMELAQVAEQEFLSLSEQKIRRRLANMLIQGHAINKLYLFNLVKEKIDAIDPSLMKCYGILASVAQLGYWAAPFGAILAALGNREMQAGSEEVEPVEDKYVIHVRGQSLNILMHELVKGIYEWISLDPSLKQAMEKETPAEEEKDIIAGPELAKAFMSYIPANKHELVPLIHKKFLQLEKDDIKDVFAKSLHGKEIMQRLIDEAEAEWAEYHKQKEGESNE